MEYTHKPFPSSSESLQPNDLVFVKQGKKIFSKGIVIHFVSSGDFAGRYKILFPDGSHYHCRPERLIRIEAPQTILCVRETNDYRRIAKTQVCPDDHVLEIGSDFGHTTNLISQITSNVIGIDKSVQQHEVSKKDFPHIPFYLMDVLGEKPRFRELPNCNKVFIDINGNRELEAVQEAVALVIDTMRPELIVVKSRSYFDHQFKEKSIEPKLEKV
jgi:hypothetical protein